MQTDIIKFEGCAAAQPDSIDIICKTEKKGWAFICATAFSCGLFLNAMWNEPVKMWNTDFRLSIIAKERVELLVYYNLQGN